MKTSLTDIQQIDDHLSGKLTAGDKLLFDARLLIDPVLRFNVHMQKKLMKLLKAYSRRTVRQEVLVVQDKVFLDDSFRNEILSIFSKP